MIVLWGEQMVEWDCLTITQKANVLKREMYRTGKEAVFIYNERFRFKDKPVVDEPDILKELA